METIGQIIKRARGSRGQVWLGEQLGIAQTTISQWERDVVVPRPDKFPAIEEALNLQPGTLAAVHYGTPEPAPYRPPVAGFEHLTPEKQDAVISIVRAFLIEQGLDPDNPEPLNPDGTPNHHHDG